MAEVYPSGPGKPGGERPNPSVESTKKDDAYDRGVHENQEGVGAAMGAGLGCLGVALAPWLLVGFGIVAAIALIFVVKSCGR